jgi:hypothetical protein
MNERIKELLKQATTDINPEDREWVFSRVDQAKFAELIVRECVRFVAKRKNQAIDDGCNVDEAMSVAEMDLLEHFGVE